MFRSYLWSDTLAVLAGSELITIAAISGNSPAGGAVLALTLDYRIMAKGNYKIGLNESAVLPYFKIQKFIFYFLKRIIEGPKAKRK